MSDTLAVAVAVGVPLYAATTLVLALGARAWANAIGAVHQASYAAVQANAARAADDALADLNETPRPQRTPYTPPSEDELRDVLLAERGLTGPNIHSDEDASDYSTTRNEMDDDDVPPIPPGGLYNTRQHGR